MNIAPPSITDFLPNAIQKAVRERALTHAATLYPLAVGAGFGVTAFLFEMPLFYITALCSIVLSLLWVIIQIFFLNDKIGGKYINELNQQQQKYQAYLRKELQNELQECKIIKEAEDIVEQALNHCIKIEEKLESIKDILQLKVKNTEITYGRFAGAAEQVTLSFLDNLQDIAAILKSAGSIDIDYIKNRLEQLEKKDNDITDKDIIEENIKQKKALLERLLLKDQQFKKINALLSKNEEAMTEMEKISAALSEWESQDDFTDIDFESAISRLHELAEQAHEYKNH